MSRTQPVSYSSDLRPDGLLRLQLFPDRWAFRSQR